MKTLVCLSLVGTLCALSACATSYGPLTVWGGTGGFTDKKISDGKFYIESLVNVSTGPAKALEYWHKRASELCNGKDYENDVVLTIHKNSNYGGTPGVVTQHDWPLAKGTATCVGTES